MHNIETRQQPKIKDPLERIMTTTSQAAGSQAVIPVDAMNAATGELSQDSLLNDLLSGLDDVTPAAPVTLMEQDMLAMLDIETPMTVAVAGAAVEVPEELIAAPVVTAPTLGEVVRAGVKEGKKNAAADKKSTSGTKAGKAAPKVGDKTQKHKAGETQAPTAAPDSVKALTVTEPGESSLEESTAAPDVAPVKKTSAPRMTFAKKSEKIVHKLGDKAKEFLILDTKDADLSDEELQAKQDTLLKYIDEELAVKIGEKATMLFGYLRNGGKLNEIMRRTFTVLLRDGFLTSGSKGNLVTDFELKPYSPGTAASQSNQMFGLFPLLSICHAKSGGRMELNPDSTILQKMKAELGL